mgnify:CR=1 FL=1
MEQIGLILITFIIIGDDLTTGAFWFYFNTTFFPHDL